MGELKSVIGWREWVGLPGLALPPIKAKVDSGAKTSCLHAFKLKPFSMNGEKWVRFWVHPGYGGTRKMTRMCERLLEGCQLLLWLRKSPLVSHKGELSSLFALGIKAL